MLNRGGQICLALQPLEAKQGGIYPGEGVRNLDSRCSEQMEALIQSVGLSKEMSEVLHTRKTRNQILSTNSVYFSALYFSHF